MGDHLHQNYELGNILGKGSYSEVLEAKRRHQTLDSNPLHPEEERVVVKRIKKSNLISSTEQQIPEREIANLRILGKHPHAIFMHAHFEDDDHVFIVMEHGGCFTLEQHLLRNPLGLFHAKIILFQLLLAVQHLHEYCKLIHFDIAPKNVLWNDEDQTVKLCDFGMATKQSEVHLVNLSCMGTPAYSAPEISCFHPESSPVSESVDLYSLGVVSYEVLTGISPKSFFQSHAGIAFPEEFWQMKDVQSLWFTEALLSHKSVDRPTIGQALTHAWFEME